MADKMDTIKLVWVWKKKCFQNKVMIILCFVEKEISELNWDQFVDISSECEYINTIYFWQCFKW